LASWPFGKKKKELALEALSPYGAEGPEGRYEDLFERLRRAEEG